MTEPRSDDAEQHDPDGDPEMKQTAGTQQDQAEGGDDPDETG
jgi:hypothetical protein